MIVIIFKHLEETNRSMTLKTKYITVFIPLKSIHLLEQKLEQEVHSNTKPEQQLDNVTAPTRNNFF